MRKKTDTIFKPAFGLGNKHIQTMFASIFKKEKNLQFEKKRFFLQDGDFLECYWHKIQQNREGTPIVILFHGLTGNYKSPYIQRVVKRLNKEGFNSVLMHFRGCTGEDNKLPRSYHSGETSDALEFIQTLKKEFVNTPLFAVGYSLGGNMLLKLLGELAENSLIEKAVAISPPMQLDICANKMNSGFSRYYQYRLLKSLNASLDKKYDIHDMQKLIGLKREDIQNLKTFWDFDAAYTAPIHGFTSVQDYYTKSSSKQYLKHIQTPTLIIHSEDDPFMTPELIPQQSELSSSVTLELTQKGGHVGFVGGTLFQVTYWLEERIIQFLSCNQNQTDSL